MKIRTYARLMHWIRASTLVLMALTAILLVTHASAAELSVVGGLGMHSTSFEPPVAGATEKSKTSIAYGALVELGMNPHWGFETGALYGSHEGRVEVDPQNYVDFRQKGLVVPAVFRFHFSPAFSLGLGGYYSLNLGNSTSTTTAGGVTGAEVDSGSKTPDDYGLVGSLKVEIPLGARVRLAVDGRYDWGLKSVDLNGSTGKFRDLYGLAGFVFAL